MLLILNPGTTKNFFLALIYKYKVAEASWDDLYSTKSLKAIICSNTPVVWITENVSGREYLWLKKAKG